MRPPLRSGLIALVEDIGVGGMTLSGAPGRLPGASEDHELKPGRESKVG
jgi:hypothetical protein